MQSRNEANEPVPRHGETIFPLQRMNYFALQRSDRVRELKFILSIPFLFCSMRLVSFRVARIRIAEKFFGPPLFSIRGSWQTRATRHAQSLSSKRIKSEINIL